MKHCKLCGEHKPLASYSLVTNRKTGIKEHRGECRACYRSNKLKYRYGIDQTDYNIMSRQHFDRCAICGTHASTQTHGVLHVDHDHATGAIRGLLCGKCNRGLGYFNDNTDMLKNAALYLAASRHREALKSDLPALADGGSPQ
jgi:hypothetical protein